LSKGSGPRRNIGSFREGTGPEDNTGAKLRSRSILRDLCDSVVKLYLLFPYSSILLPTISTIIPTCQIFHNLLPDLISPPPACLRILHLVSNACFKHLFKSTIQPNNRLSASDTKRISRQLHMEMKKVRKSPQSLVTYCKIRAYDKCGNSPIEKRV